MIRTICLTLLVSLALFPVNASPVYWNLLNAEGTVDTAVFVSYHSLPDMLNDENRVGSFTADGFSPFTGSNIVGTGSDGTTYWNLFNTAPQIAAFVTYSSPLDMFNDENRLGIFVADGFSPAAGALVVGTGSDGIAYWNRYNAENETAAFVTYSSRLDMLNDENRLGVSVPDGFSPAAGAAIAGTGSDGTTYWNLFNAEGIDDIAVFATYGSLLDMLNDENRIDTFIADGMGPAAGRMIVGTGASISGVVPPVPEPASGWLLAFGLGGYVLRRRTRRPGAMRVVGPAR